MALLLSAAGTLLIKGVVAFYSDHVAVSRMLLLNFCSGHVADQGCCCFQHRLSVVAFYSCHVAVSRVLLLSAADM